MAERAWGLDLFFLFTIFSIPTALPLMSVLYPSSYSSCTCSAILRWWYSTALGYSSSLELDSSSLSSSSSSSCSLELDESCHVGWCLHECLAVRLLQLEEEVDSCSFFVIPILYSWAMI